MGAYHSERLCRHNSIIQGAREICKKLSSVLRTVNYRVEARKIQVATANLGHINNRSDKQKFTNLSFFPPTPALGRLPSCNTV